jgi:hypothetical protein
MEFKPVYSLAKIRFKIESAVSGLGLFSGGLAAFVPAERPEPRKPDADLPKGGDALAEASQNLLKHIPGEASGFYLLAVDSITKPSLRTLGLIFVLALVLLVLVRWVAKASWAVLISTVIAFGLWMLILDQGFLHAAFPSLLPPPLGFIVAVFYSSVITILSSAGYIR